MSLFQDRALLHTFMVVAPTLSAARGPYSEVSGFEASLSDYIEWDVRNWSAILDFWKRNSSQQLSGLSALEVGSRHGGLSLWLAMQGARVVCSDLNGPSAKAVLVHRARGIDKQVEYRALDATASPYCKEFDVISFKSVLGGIGARGGKESQRLAINEIHKSLKEGGELFFAENLIASPIHQFFRRQFVSWSAKWRYVSVPEVEEFLSPFKEVNLCVMGFAGAFGRNETQRNWLGLLDKLLFDHLVPNSWKYIIAGVARK